MSDAHAPRAPRAPRRPPSVAFVGLRGVPDIQGGIETHVAQLASRLAGRGWRVEVLGRSPYLPGGRREWNGVGVTPLWSPRGRAFEAIAHTALCLLALARRPPDVLHIHAIGPALLAPLARLLPGSLVVTHHGYDYERQKWGPLAKAMLRLGERLGMRFAHARIGVSRAVAGAMQDRYRRQTRFIPNGVDIAKPRRGASLLAGFGTAPRRYVLMVARLVEEKRQLDLIAAFARLADLDVDLVLVGGADHGGRYRDRVAAAAAAVPRAVLAGVQTGEALAQLYAHASLFVLPSSHEGMPIALLEAIAHGLPVLASAIPANLALELPRDCYVPLGDVAALASAMRAALAAGGDAPRRQDAAARPGWDQVAVETIEVYEAAMRRAGPRRSFLRRLSPRRRGRRAAGRP